MIKKFFSLIIIPHHKGSAKTITLSEKKVKVLAGFLALLFIVLTAFLVDYFTMNVTRKKYRALCDDSARQQQILAQYKMTLNSLKTTIEYLDKYAKKLNVMAGLKSPDVLKEIGIGGGENNNGQTAKSSNSYHDIGFDRTKNINQRAKGIEKNLNTLTRFFEDQSLRLACTPSIRPTVGWMTSSFGWRDDPFTGRRTFHYGIDIATHYGNPVVATADGVISRLKRDKIGGKTVIISHRGGYSTIYCHLSKFLAKPGQRVKRGDVIGLIGKTGKALGPHVHYEVRLNGKHQNPYYYILEE